MNFVEELTWRGMLHQMMPGTKELFDKGEMVTAYVGIDPTADSLHIGHLCGVMMLRHVGYHTWADLVENAVRDVLMEGKVLTRDLGGHASTTEYTDAIVARILSRKEKIS